MIFHVCVFTLFSHICSCGCKVFVCVFVCLHPVNTQTTVYFSGTRRQVSFILQRWSTRWERHKMCASRLVWTQRHTTGSECVLCSCVCFKQTQLVSLLYLKRKCEWGSEMNRQSHTSCIITNLYLIACVDTPETNTHTHTYSHTHLFTHTHTHTYSLTHTQKGLRLKGHSAVLLYLSPAEQNTVDCWAIQSTVIRQHFTVRTHTHTHTHTHTQTHTLFLWYQQVKECSWRAVNSSQCPSCSRLVTWSPGPLVTWSPGRLVTWTPGHLVTWSPGHFWVDLKVSC